MGQVAPVGGGKGAFRDGCGRLYVGLPMRVFVYEYTCALTADAASESLRAEGRAMLSAALEDFRRVPGVEAVTLPAGGGREAFCALARSADTTLVIAPEFDGILAERCRWVEEVGGRLLGPSSAAVRLTADKLLTARRLRAAGVPTPDCAPFPDPVAFPAVLKPRDGAGSQATFLVRNEEELTFRAEHAAREGWRGELIVQTFAPGMAASVAFLLGWWHCVPLLPTAQHLSDDGRFRYLGGSMPLPVGLRERAVNLARRAVGAVPELSGYVGVDVVLGETDQVIEINPRLTTSYVGLRALAETNLAEAMLGVAAGEVITLSWRKGEVRFAADGTL
jgi:predicted ATP-grasp superfamily ATP-dependent carboligase